MCEGSNFSTSLPTLVILKCIYFYYGHLSGRLLYGGDFESVEMKTRFLSGSSRELLDKLNDAHSLGSMFWKNSSFVLLHPAPGMQTVIFQGYWWAGKWGIGPEQIKKPKLYIYIYIAKLSGFYNTFWMPQLKISVGQNQLWAQLGNLNTEKSSLE